MNYKESYFKFHRLEKCDSLYCIMCGTVAQNLHHILHKSKEGTDAPDNLVPMCFNCHSGHHDQNNPTTKQIENANNIKGFTKG